MEGFVRFLVLAKPYFGVLFMQLGSAGMAIIAKFALNKGMSQYVFVFYRMIIATLIMAPFAIIFERSFIIPFFDLFRLSTYLLITNHLWCLFILRHTQQILFSAVHSQWFNHSFSCTKLFFNHSCLISRLFSCLIKVYWLRLWLHKDKYSRILINS